MHRQTCSRDKNHKYYSIIFCCAKIVNKYFINVIITVLHNIRKSKQTINFENVVKKTEDFYQIFRCLLIYIIKPLPNLIFEIILFSTSKLLSAFFVGREKANLIYDRSKNQKLIFNKLFRFMFLFKKKTKFISFLKLDFLKLNCFCHDITESKKSLINLLKFFKIKYVTNYSYVSVISLV